MGEKSAEQKERLHWMLAAIGRVCAQDSGQHAQVLMTSATVSVSGIDARCADVYGRCSVGLRIASDSVRPVPRAYELEECVRYNNGITRPTTIT